MPNLTLTFEDFDALRNLIHAHSGIWLSDDKLTFLEVRLADCLRRTAISSPREYYHFLKYDPRGEEEVLQLVDAVTVNETWFFRETGPFLAWREAVMPGLIKNGKRIRLWSAGCSSGDEPYTLGMLLLEIRPKVALDRLSILATDISERVLEKARIGLYDHYSLRHTEPHWLNQYFETKVDGLYGIDERLRKMVQLHRNNLVEPGLGERMEAVDLILCRNVIIYFDEPSRKAVMANFHAALKPGGYLILGMAETLAHTLAPFEVTRLEGAILYRKPSTR